MTEPGQHVVVVVPHVYEAYKGRYLGLKLRDTILIIGPWGTLYAFLFRVPLEESTVAAQVLKTGTGGLWIDGSRVGPPRNDKRPGRGAESGNHGRGLPSLSRDWGAWEATKGRWPPNLLLVHHPECVQDGTKKVKPGNGSGRAHGVNASANNLYGLSKGRKDKGGGIEDSFLRTASKPFSPGIVTPPVLLRSWTGSRASPCPRVVVTATSPPAVTPEERHDSTHSSKIWLNAWIGWID